MDSPTAEKLAKWIDDDIGGDPEKLLAEFAEEFPEVNAAEFRAALISRKSGNDC